MNFRRYLDMGIVYYCMSADHGDIVSHGKTEARVIIIGVRITQVENIRVKSQKSLMATR